MISIVAGVLLVVSLAWPGRDDGTMMSWESVAEGYVVVPTPCCTEAALSNEVNSITDEGQRMRPASAVEAAAWLNAWPYGDLATEVTKELQVAAKNREVRCVGEPTGPEIIAKGNDVETLGALQWRQECTYAKWRVWSPETAEERPNERHKVWADEDGFFHGRVDYWK